MEILSVFVCCFLKKQVKKRNLPLYTYLQGQPKKVNLMTSSSSTSRIIEQLQSESLKKFFLRIDEESSTASTSNTFEDKKIKITICDGKNVWESSKSIYH